MDLEGMERIAKMEGSEFDRFSWGFPKEVEVKKVMWGTLVFGVMS